MGFVLDQQPNVSAATPSPFPSGGEGASGELAAAVIPLACGEVGPAVRPVPAADEEKEQPAPPPTPAVGDPWGLLRKPLPADNPQEGLTAVGSRQAEG
jgi:hypothetical protein